MALLALLAAIVSIAALFTVAESARAAEAPPVNGHEKFCWGQPLGPKNSSTDYCESWGSQPTGQGAPTYVKLRYKVEAWGGLHSVCVIVDGTNEGCSSGPESKVVVSGETCNGCAAPLRVINNATGNNTSYGWVYEYPPATGGSSPPATGWTYEQLGGEFLENPTILTTSPGNMNVFAKGLDGNLWQKWTSGGAWSAWQNVSALSGSGPIASGPGATSWGEGRVDAVARMSNNSVGHWYTAGGAWHYDNLGSEILGEPDIVSANAGYLDVFARGLDGNLWEKQWNATYWGPWVNISAIVGGPIAGSPGAVSASSGTLTVVARKSNNQIGVWSASGSNWSYQEIPGEIEGDPDIASASTGNVNVVAQGLDNRLWQIWTTGTGWSGWQALSGPEIRSSPAATAGGTASNVLDVVARDAYNQLGLWRYGN